MELAFPIIEVVGISFPIRRLHTYICTICLYKLMMTMEHKISCKKNDVCWVFKKNFENWKKEQGRRRNMIFLSIVLYLVDFYRITLSFTKWSRNLSWFKHYTTKQGNIFCWYFFLFWYIFWTCGIGMLFFISLEFVMGGEDQVRKKWHCCIYNITTIWIQIFHTSNSILGTLRFQKGVHNLTRIFLKNEVVFTYYVL